MSIEKKRPHTNRHVSNSLEENGFINTSLGGLVPSESEYLSING